VAAQSPLHPGDELDQPRVRLDLAGRNGGLGAGAFDVIGEGAGDEAALRVVLGSKLLGAWGGALDRGAAQRAAAHPESEFGGGGGDPGFRSGGGGEVEPAPVWSGVREGDLVVDLFGGWRFGGGGVQRAAAPPSAGCGGGGGVPGFRSVGRGKVEPAPGWRGVREGDLVVDLFGGWRFGGGGGQDAAQVHLRDPALGDEPLDAPYASGV